LPQILELVLLTPGCGLQSEVLRRTSIFYEGLPLVCDVTLHPDIKKLFTITGWKFGAEMLLEAPAKPI
jgi:hypothetical protein